MNDDKLIAEDIKAYLKQHENKELLRFITCGSVDDGKSTLIGRLLHDSKMIFTDQLAAIENDSKKSGTTGEKIDLALLVDGLQSEREQGITIDVAYRYFATTKRKFIIADTPGHEQYTRNMATGASTADLAIILIDARYGVVTQTKRHSFIVSLLGIKNVIIAVNKMDLVNFKEDVYEQIKSDYEEFAKDLKITNKIFIPISALNGDNVVNKSEISPWYDGETLMHALENINTKVNNNNSFRFPVQYVNRPNLNFRGFCGSVASGSIKVGDEIVALPSKKSSKVKEIVTYDGNIDEAIEKEAITITLEDEVDISRGDMIVKKDELASCSNHIKAHIVWMDENPLNLVNSYYIKKGAKITSANFVSIDHKIDVNTLAKEDAINLKLNEIAVVNVNLLDQLVFDKYEDNRFTGRFIIIDKITNNTVGAGMIIESNEAKKSQFSSFELEMNALVRKYFPHWESKDIGLQDFNI
ncbi:MAG: Sulfate adenylyltransferase subunit 1 (EC [uncultured Campylobacterales bacterium]|uniref:Sulfate adenylyltransferase subunit 1 n=1 Tax=uncultured Campylobacterales bacterium TaxID=352960 RepID=A0A6S6SAX3_9BACT|nr:MAG: Sulfate adenylyltransferase subunit 1 (EC [uncultured Campylobacterales bacterium]